MPMNSWDFDDPALQTLQRPDGSYHTPVMAEEIVALPRPAPGMIFLDGTAVAVATPKNFFNMAPRSSLWIKTLMRSPDVSSDWQPMRVGCIQRNKFRRGRCCS